VDENIARSQQQQYICSTRIVSNRQGCSLEVMFTTTIEAQIHISSTVESIFWSNMTAADI
jgi:hypothetical protein